MNIWFYCIFCRWKIWDDVIEAHCYVDIEWTDHEQIHNRINSNRCRTLWLSRPLSTVYKTLVLHAVDTLLPTCLALSHDHNATIYISCMLYIVSPSTIHIYLYMQSIGAIGWNEEQVKLYSRLTVAPCHMRQLQAVLINVVHKKGLSEPNLKYTSAFYISHYTQFIE